MIIINPTRTATLEPVIMDNYESTPLTFKQRIKRMDLGYHAVIIGLRLLQALLFAIGVTFLIHGDDLWKMLFNF